MTDTPAKPSYNLLYEKFIDPSAPIAQRLPGIIAYGLYKEAKREWACEIFKDRARTPTQQELDDYIRTWTTSRISGAKEQAEGALGEFAAAVVEANAPAIREEALRGTFWRSVWQSIFANVAYTLILIFIAIVLKFAGIDFLSALTSVSGR